MRLSTISFTLSQLSAVMAAGLLMNNDRIPQQTAVANDYDYDYDGGFSPAPTPGPALWGRDPDLRLRSLGPDSCGIANLAQSKSLFQ